MKFGIWEAAAFVGGIYIGATSDHLFAPETLMKFGLLFGAMYLAERYFAGKAESQAAGPPPRPDEVSFDCPHCGSTLAAPTQHAGEVRPCASCGRQIVIPGGQQPAPPDGQVVFLCPACRDELSASTQHAGEEHPCPNCGQGLIIPGGKVQPPSQPQKSTAMTLAKKYITPENVGTLIDLAGRVCWPGKKR